MCFVVYRQPKQAGYHLFTLLYSYHFLSLSIILAEFLFGELHSASSAFHSTTGSMTPPSCGGRIAAERPAGRGFVKVDAAKEAHFVEKSFRVEMIHENFAIVFDIY